MPQAYQIPAAVTARPPKWQGKFPLWWRASGGLWRVRSWHRTKAEAAREWLRHSQNKGRYIFIEFRLDGDKRTRRVDIDAALERGGS